MLEGDAAIRGDRGNIVEVGPWKAVLVFVARQTGSKTAQFSEAAPSDEREGNVQARKSSRPAHRRAMIAVKPPAAACCVATCP
jgi:hypothetical protein